MGADPEWLGLKAGDWATWFGAIGSAAAATAAWLASRQAIRIAKMPLFAADKERNERARIIAPAIASELSEIESECSRIERNVDGAFQISTPEGRKFLSAVRFNSMEATGRSLQFINCFKPEDASLVLSVYAEIGKLRTRIDVLNAVPAVTQFTGEMRAAERNQSVHKVVEQAKKTSSVAKNAVETISLYANGS